MNDIGKQIALELAKYPAELQDEVNKIAESVSRSASTKLKVNSPKNTGIYSKGWTVKKQKTTYIVYNKERPRLTHLLEHGYYNKKGQKKVQGKPHIGPVEQEAIREFEHIVEELIK